MKQYIVLGIALILLIGLYIYQCNYLKNTSVELLSTIDNINNYLFNNDFDKASSEISRLEATWKKNKQGWDILTEHNDIEELESHIQSLKAFAKAKAFSESVNESYIIKQKIEHILENESLSFATIF